MTTQTADDMGRFGADRYEAEEAQKLWELLLPGLRVKPNGRVDTSWGDKTPLGLYRTIKRIMEGI